MSRIHHASRRLFLLSVFTLGGAICAGGADRRAEAPTATPRMKPAPATAYGVSSGSYELRGFFGRAGRLEVSIRKSGTPESRWIRVGAPTGDWRVESADAKAGTAVLLADGKRFPLKLATSEDAPTALTDASGEPLKSWPSQREAMTRAAERDAAIDRAKEEALSRLRAAHPEYFKEANLMTPEERRVSRNALNEVDRQNAALRDSLPVAQP